MSRMILLSTFLHFFFIGILPAMPFFKAKKITYTPVYTVNLVNLPLIIRKKGKLSKKTKPGVLLPGETRGTVLAKLKILEKKIKQAKKLKNKSGMGKSDLPKKRVKLPTKTKLVNLLSGKKRSTALAKLKILEKKIKQEKTLQNRNEIEESDIPGMLASLDKIAEAENESGFIDNSEERKDKILEELNKLEGEWSKNKNRQLDFEKIEKSKSLEQLEALEKKWQGEAAGLQAGAMTDESGIEEWSKGKNNRLDFGKTAKSKSIEQLEELEKKWNEEAAKLQPNVITDESGIYEALAKFAGTVTSASTQNVNETPPHLLIYYLFIKNKAISQWKNPSGIEILSEKETNKKTVVSFNIIRSGKIEDYKIDESSGNRVLDHLALEAVKNSDPLPPLPSTYHENFLRVFLDFNYTLK